MARLPQQLIDEPSFIASSFQGYFHEKDPTLLPFNTLTFPSVNCSIPDFDTIVPDKGKTLLGQDFTENTPIIGNKEKFKNLGGLEMEVRVWASGDRDRKDVIEIYFINNRLLFGTLVGSFQEGETIKGGTSGETAIIDSILNTVLYVSDVTGDFTIGETITGQSSGATAVVITPPTSEWRPITEDPNPLGYGVHEYYFDEWFDTNLNPALTLRLPRLIWVNGDDDGGTPPGGFVYSWTGGVALITAVTATNITIDPSTTWRSLGFTEDTSTGGGGNAYVVVNQTKYTLVDPNDLDTNSIDVTDTTGVSVGDFATSRIEQDSSPIPFDMCRENNGYMYYGNWNERYLYQSNAFNRDNFIRVTDYQAIQNDLIVRSSTAYTGTTESVFTVTISNVAENPYRYFLNPGGAALDNLRFYYNDYDLAALNTYRVVITGVAPDLYDWYKNGVLQAAGVAIVPGALTLLADDVYILFSDIAPAAYVVTTAWSLVIGGTDKFKWQKDGGALSAATAITGGNQNLSDGVQIKFGNLIGHEVGDTWVITASPAISRAWDNFYYTLPTRKIGEGYQYRLPSNFWTMDKQEDSMYVNSSYGEWNIVTTQISSDLQSESVNVTPLKQAGSEKVIHPYMTGHIGNDLCYVTVDKKLNFIGRQQFLEKPQIGFLSEPVNNDFLASTFVGGRIKYLDKKLYVSSPSEGITHCYDTYKKYWNPPKTFIEVGILSIIGNNLICHSNVRNRSFSMFTNDDGDNGQGYTVVARTAYTDVGDRWHQKSSNISFTEGYIEGSPQLIHTVYQGVLGCGGISSHEIEPILCVQPGDAPLGAGALGSHPLGSDDTIIGSYFQEMYKAYSPVMKYYLVALEIACTAKTHTWRILSLGLNGMLSPQGNSVILNPSNLPD